jgi:hypothetical protein
VRIAQITPEPSPEEVSAIAAAIAVLEDEARRRADAARESAEHLQMWVHASRRAAQRAGMQRGPWRMSGRIARRSRT